MTITELAINVHGCEFKITGNAESALQNVESDFRYFRTASTEAPFQIELAEEDPPYDQVPASPATVYTPRNVSLTEDGCTYVDYGGRALGIWHRSGRLLRLFSREPDLLYEAAYLFLLSRIGEYLDRCRMHRIHAMAVELHSRAILTIMPMGGGKSTLTHGLLRYPEFGFLSDDSPFISRDGRVHAFPLRLGLLPGGETGIPPEYLRRISRMEFGPKVLVNYEYFADRIRPSADPGIVFLGRRNLSTDCWIEPVSFREKHSSIMADCVVGLGLFQGLEFLLQRSPLELAGKIGTAWSRLVNAERLFAGSEVYRLMLGRDQDRNAEVVRDFIHDRIQSPRRVGSTRNESLQRTNT